MKKMRNLFIILLMAAGSLVSCTETETANVSAITNFPTFNMVGEDLLFIDQNSDWTDPGVTATEDGVEIPVTTSAVGTYNLSQGSEVDVNTADIYSILYSAENSDGFTGSTQRVVWVIPPSGDLVNSISGLYKANVQRAPDFASTPQYSDMFYIFISKNDDNTYKISHAIGGYYDYGRGYGSGYAAKGAIITANDIPGNDFSVSQAVFPLWGNTADITGMKVNPASKSITFLGTTNFGNGEFEVQLTQVEFQ